MPPCQHRWIPIRQAIDLTVSRTNATGCVRPRLFGWRGSAGLLRHRDRQSPQHRLSVYRALVPSFVCGAAFRRSPPPSPAGRRWRSRHRTNLPSNSSTIFDSHLDLTTRLHCEGAGRDIDGAAAFRLADDVALLVVRRQQGFEGLRRVRLLRYSGRVQRTRDNERGGPL